MLSCARAMRGLRSPSLGLLARLGVPVGGRVRKPRTVGDSLARPQEGRWKSGGRSMRAVKGSLGHSSKDWKYPAPPAKFALRPDTPIEV